MDCKNNMKKFTILAMFVAVVLSVSAQYKMHVYENGKKTSFSVANVDSITFEKEDIIDNQCVGAFSVSADKQIVFSPGNLQYTRSTDTWSFAENQYDYIGTDNVTGGSVSTDATYGDSKSGTALADKVDLFGWSTSATNFGVSTSTSSSDYSGSFVDWGINKIGNDDSNTWRTLTYDEWYYLRYNRTNANDLCGVAQVNGVNGILFLPDNWVCPADVTFKSGFYGSFDVDYYAAYQTFTSEQWAKMEAAGAVFLPAAGYRYITYVGNVQTAGYYWSATEYDVSRAGYFVFSSDHSNMMDFDCARGRSVRLVKDLNKNIFSKQ